MRCPTRAIAEEASGEGARLLSGKHRGGGGVGRGGSGGGVQSGGQSGGGMLPGTAAGGERDYTREGADRAYLHELIHQRWLSEQRAKYQRCRLCRLVNPGRLRRRRCWVLPRLRRCSVKLQQLHQQRRGARCGCILIRARLSDV